MLIFWLLDEFVYEMERVFVLFLLYVMLVFFLDMFFIRLMMLINVEGEFWMNILWLIINESILNVK